jgi:hypothetical protein
MKSLTNIHIKKRAQIAPQIYIYSEINAQKNNFELRKGNPSLDHDLEQLG